GITSHLILWVSVSLCYKVIQPGGEVIAAEGDSVTLSCTFETSDAYPYLFWYKQESSSSPQFIIADFSAKTEKFSVQHNKQKQEFYLQISSAAVSDSAVYYCAVRCSEFEKELWMKPKAYQVQASSFLFSPFQIFLHQY
uniref:Ig-like domain-containing protein n=1 Tax=Oryzias melastigma TaxID=30732 RepID=A0A3B3BW80_ORYME